MKQFENTKDRNRTIGYNVMRQETQENKKELQMKNTKNKLRKSDLEFLKSDAFAQALYKMRNVPQCYINFFVFDDSDDHIRDAIYKVHRGAHIMIDALDIDIDIDLYSVGRRYNFINDYMIGKYNKDFADCTDHGLHFKKAYFAALDNYICEMKKMFDKYDVLKREFCKKYNVSF